MSNNPHLLDVLVELVVTEVDVFDACKSDTVPHVLSGFTVSQPAVVCDEWWADVGPECSPLEVKTAHDLISRSFIL